MKKIFIKNLGQTRYLDAWNIQKKVASEIQQNIDKKLEIKHTLLITEHFPVYTTGIRSKKYDYDDEQKLKKMGAEFYHTNRGGLITFHGPGQLVAYPILHLSSFGKGIKWYVSYLENIVISTCAKMGIKANTSPHTGIWVGDNKICALGIQGRHITQHGLALNCNTDMSWFDHIVPCGIEGKGVTSISKELKMEKTIDDVLPYIISSFGEIFDAEMIIDN